MTLSSSPIHGLNDYGHIKISKTDCNKTGSHQKKPPVRPAGKQLRHPWRARFRSYSIRTAKSRRLQARHQERPLFAWL